MNPACNTVMFETPGKNITMCLCLYGNQSILPSRWGTPSSRSYRVGPGEKVQADVREKEKKKKKQRRWRERFQSTQGRTMTWREHTTWWEQRKKVLEGSSAFQRHGCCSSKHHCQIKCPTRKFSKWHLIFCLEKGEMMKPEKQTVALPIILLVSITVTISVRVVTNSQGFLPDGSQDKLARV